MHGESQEKSAPFTPELIPETGEIAYNNDERKTPGGLKTRWIIRVATGPEAAQP
jgi:hypothetical protein